MATTYRSSCYAPVMDPETGVYECPLGYDDMDCEACETQRDQDVDSLVDMRRGN